MGKTIAEELASMKRLHPKQRVKRKLEIWSGYKKGNIFDFALLNCLIMGMDTATAQSIVDEARGKE